MHTRVRAVNARILTKLDVDLTGIELGKSYKQKLQNKQVKVTKNYKVTKVTKKVTKIQNGKSAFIAADLLF